jgi:hypothetical protein
MLEIITGLESRFPSLFASAFLATSTTPAVTPGVHTAGAERSFHLKYRQQDISSGGVPLRHLHSNEQAFTTINIWPSDTARTLLGGEK